MSKSIERNKKTDARWKTNDALASSPFCFSQTPTIRPLGDGPDLVAEPAVRRGLLALAGVVRRHQRGESGTRPKKRKESVDRRWKRVRERESFFFFFFSLVFFFYTLEARTTLYSCSGTGAAHTGHVASLIPRLPTHRSSHSRQQVRWKAWPHASCIRGLSGVKGSRQVGQESSSSSLSVEEGRRFGGFVAASLAVVVTALRLDLLEGRGGAGMALDAAVVVEGPEEEAAAAAAAELVAFGNRGSPSSEAFRHRCCLLRPPLPSLSSASPPPLPRSARERGGRGRGARAGSPRATSAAAAANAAAAAAAEAPPLGDSGGDSGLGGGLYWRLFLGRAGDVTWATEPRRLGVRVCVFFGVGREGEEEVEKGRRRREAMSRLAFFAHSFLSLLASLLPSPAAPGPLERGEERRGAAAVLLPLVVEVERRHDGARGERKKSREQSKPRRKVMTGKSFHAF